METVLTALFSFAVTNIDDILILVLFFSMTGPAFRPRQIVIGHYLGFCAILFVSLTGYFVRFFIPREWIGILGLVPILIGIHKLFEGRKEEDDPKIEGRFEQVSPPSLFRSLFDPKIYSVTAVTFANGGDNIGIYTPLFATLELDHLILTIGIFLILVAVWCFAGYRLSRIHPVARTLSGWGYKLVPFVLIALGIYILAENGTFGILNTGKP